jgi:hypothetical protein
MDHTNEEVIEQVANEVNEMSERAILFSKNIIVIPFKVESRKYNFLTFLLFFSILTFFKTKKMGVLRLQLPTDPRWVNIVEKHRGNLD